MLTSLEKVVANKWPYVHTEVIDDIKQHHAVMMFVRYYSLIVFIVSLLQLLYILLYIFQGKD